MALYPASWNKSCKTKHTMAPLSLKRLCAHGIFLLLFAGSDILVPYSWAQQTLDVQDSEGDRFGIALNNHRQTFHLFAMRPTYRSAVRFLQSSRDFLVDHLSRYPTVVAVERPQGAHDTVRGRYAISGYIAERHNPLLNATALAEQVAFITGRDSIKDEVVAATWDVIPMYSQVPRGAILPDVQIRNQADFWTDLLQRDGDYHATSYQRRASDRSTQSQVHGVQVQTVRQAISTPVQTLVGATRSWRAELSRRADLTVGAISAAARLENEKILVATYWKYRGLYERDLPPNTTEGNRQAVREVVSRALYDSEMRELVEVVLDVRNELTVQNASQTRSRHLSRLLENLNEAHQSLNLVATQMNTAQSASEGLRYLEISLQRFPERPMLMHINRAMREMIDQVAPLVGVLAGRTRPVTCGVQGQVLVPQSLQPQVRSLMGIFNQSADQDRLAQDFLNYLQTQRPSAAVVTSLDRDICGYGRRQFVMQWFQQKFQFYYPQAATARARWNLLKAQTISQERLFFTNTFRTLFDLDFEGYRVDLTGADFTLVQVQAALQEQTQAIRREAQELANLGTGDRDIAKLLSMNPAAMWRAVARDGRLLAPLARAYEVLERVQNEQALTTRVLFWAGLTAGTLAFLSGVGVVGGPWILYTGLGLTIGMLATGVAVRDAFEAHSEYQAMVRRILTGLNANTNDQLTQLQVLLGQFHTRIAQATLAGFFTVFDVVTVVRSIRNARQLATAIRAIPREGPALAIAGHDTEIDRLIANLGREPEEAVRIRINALIQNNSHLSREAWLEAVQSQFAVSGLASRVNPEELIAFLWAHHRRVMARVTAQGAQTGALSYLQLRQTVANAVYRMLRRQSTATVGMSAPSLLSRQYARLRVFLGQQPLSLSNYQEVNDFFNTLLQSMHAVANPRPSVASAFMQYFNRGLTAADWQSGGPYQIFVEQVRTTYNARRGLWREMMMDASLPHPTGDSDPLFQALFATEGFWARLRQLFGSYRGTASDANHVRDLANRFTLQYVIPIMDGAAIAMTQDATADLVYGMYAQVLRNVDSSLDAATSQPEGNAGERSRLALNIDIQNYLINELNDIQVQYRRCERREYQRDCRGSDRDVILQILRQSMQDVRSRLVEIRQHDSEARLHELEWQQRDERVQRRRRNLWEVLGL